MRKEQRKCWGHVGSIRARTKNKRKLEKFIESKIRNN